MYGFSRRSWILVPLLACGCRSWSALPLTPKAIGELPTNSRVLRKGGARVLLYTGSVTADSIIGSRGDTVRVAIPRDSVTRVEKSHFAPLRTVGLFAGLAVGALAAAFIAFASSGELGGFSQ
jgi:hypothetical protein